MTSYDTVILGSSANALTAATYLARAGQRVLVLEQSAQLGGAMTTAYHLDGQDLMLTHYCIAKNQPTLRADRYDAAAGEVQFEFVRASNLPTPDAGHMRRAKYRFEGNNRFTTEWEFFAKGQRTMTEVETFTRVKPATNDD